MAVKYIRGNTRHSVSGRADEWWMTGRTLPAQYTLNVYYGQHHLSYKYDIKVARCESFECSSRKANYTSNELCHMKCVSRPVCLTEI